MHCPDTAKERIGINSPTQSHGLVPGPRAWLPGPSVSSTGPRALGLRALGPSPLVPRPWAWSTDLRTLGLVRWSQGGRFTVAHLVRLANILFSCTNYTLSKVEFCVGGLLTETCLQHRRLTLHWLKCKSSRLPEESHCGSQKSLSGFHQPS